jgi:NADH-quinone oxidoreductase subunit C
VAEAPTTAEAPPPSALELLGQALATIPGLSAVRIEAGELVATATADALVAAMTTLRDDPRFSFEQMMDLCGVDWPEREQRFDVVYNLLSVTLNQRVRVIVATDAATPVPSIHTIWPVATWWEREAWDLFGIVFSGQPDLRRILTDYGFEGHPLRKDFPMTGYVEVRYDEDRKQVVNEPVRLTQDFRSFDFLSPWEAMTTLPGDEKVFTERAEQAKG